MKHIIPLLIILFNLTITGNNTNSNLEKPIVVVIPSYNNAKWLEKNLDSVFMQKYNNYRVIYINDASKDNTKKLFEKYIKENNLENLVTFINNPTNRGILANHYTAVHMCQDHEIIVHLDSDDWFKHEEVFQKINCIYQDPNVWLTYGQYEHYFYSKKHNKMVSRLGQCREMPKNIIRAHAYREYNWITSHLRTFYAGLFKHIKLEDLLYKGHFYTSACDMAFMFPMLEMATSRIKFIDEILYVYNYTNPSSVTRTKTKQQIQNKNVILARKTYQSITSPHRKIPKNAKADIVIISQNNPTGLSETLESIYSYISGTGEIYVLHESSDEQMHKDYSQLANKFTQVTFFAINKNHFKNMLEYAIMASENEYVMFATDNVIVKDLTNISRCIQMMEKTYAYGFYLHLDLNIKKNKNLRRKQNIAPHTEIEGNIYAWQFKYGEHEWRNPNNLSMTIYKKKDMINSIKELNYNSCESLEKNWNNHIFDLYKVGLFFEKSKVVKAETSDQINPLKKFNDNRFN